MDGEDKETRGDANGMLYVVSKVQVKAKQSNARQRKAKHPPIHPPNKLFLFFSPSFLVDLIVLQWLNLVYNVGRGG